MDETVLDEQKNTEEEINSRVCEPNVKETRSEFDSAGQWYANSSTDMVSEVGKTFKQTDVITSDDSNINYNKPWRKVIRRKIADG